MPDKKVVAIYGMGLIGGSLGLALHGKGYYCIGIGRNPEKLADAFALGAADEVTTEVKEGVARADIVVLALPIELIIPTVKQIKPWIKKKTIVTDVGSVKGCIVKDAQKILASAFVGSHPMAGSEKSGMHNAVKSLFYKAGCVVVPGRKSPRAVSVITQLWRDAGAEVMVTDARTHDHMAAVCSHLPHILAYAIMGYVEHLGIKNKLIFKIPAGSFRDMTRVVMSSPDMWTGITSCNRYEIKRALQGFNKYVKKIVSVIGQRKKSALIFNRAAQSRKKMEKRF